MSRRKNKRRSDAKPLLTASDSSRPGRVSKNKIAITAACLAAAIAVGWFLLGPRSADHSVPSTPSTPSGANATAANKSDANAPAAKSSPGASSSTDPAIEKLFPLTATNAPPAETPTEETAEALAAEELATFQRLAADFPNNTNIVGVLGEVYMQRGKADEAAKCWNACLKINPRLGTAHHHLAMLALNNADYDEAARRWRIALDADPNLAGAHGGLGRVLLFQGKAEEALAELSKEIRSSPQDYEAFLDQGLALLEMERFDQAKQSFEEAVQLNPKHSRVYFGLANACRNLGESAKADEYLAKFQQLKSVEQEDFYRGVSTSEKLSDIRQRVAELRTNAGRMYRATGNLAKAEEHLRRAVQLQPAANNFALLADVFAKSGNRSQASAAWERACSLEPANERFRREYELFKQRK